MSQIILPYDEEFYNEYGVFIKPVTYPMSSKKIDGFIEIAKIQKYFQCNPVKFIDIMFNIELLDAQALIVQRSFFTKVVCCVCSRGIGKSTVIDLELMAKDMLFSNLWTYIASGSGSQAEQTFLTLERLANDNIETFQGSTGKIFKNELVIKNATGDGFSHNPNGFTYETYNGSATWTLNSNVDKKRGKSQHHVSLACQKWQDYLFSAEEIWNAGMRTRVEGQQQHVGHTQSVEIETVLQNITSPRVRAPKR